MSDFWILTVKDVELAKTWEELFSQKTETLGWGRLLWGPGAQGRGRWHLSQLFNREMVTSQDCRQHLHRNCGGAGRGLPQMAWELWAWIKVLRQKNHWVRSWAHFLGLSEHLERLYKKLEFYPSGCFSFWLTSLCIIGSSFIHLIRTDSNVFFLMEWGGRREEGSGWGTHVYLWRIHFDIWQN